MDILIVKAISILMVFTIISMLVMIFIQDYKINKKKIDDKPIVVPPIKKKPIKKKKTLKNG